MAWVIRYNVSLPWPVWCNLSRVNTQANHPSPFRQWLTWSHVYSTQLIQPAPVVEGQYGHDDHGEWTMWQWTAFTGRSSWWLPCWDERFRLHWTSNICTWPSGTARGHVLSQHCDSHLERQKLYQKTVTPSVDGFCAECYCNRHSTRHKARLTLSSSPVSEVMEVLSHYGSDASSEDSVCYSGQRPGGRCPAVWQSGQLWAVWPRSRCLHKIPKKPGAQIIRITATRTSKLLVQ